MRDEVLVLAFEKGQSASRRGDPVASNPHLPSSPKYQAWTAGWLDEEGPKYTGRMTCQRCGKRLSRKTARMINGEVMCSTCMFAPNPKQEGE